ncbi:hypothetical protein QM467_15920 [Rhodoblastus sp. 17X3]|uniref:hypothetical protein n=1 Tax=Rhodoblastus sp. 17X3 TaxID=3047026 RepID=UPI0024B6DDB3|nr:hypothetical protein [Rhodoblastus sp. 17X3]MDI9849543.1 hypothetical protein [Rhodoblastus sp. 17X3]
MLSEYAVEPAAIGADWNTFRYLIEKFGSDKGRLISRFPNKWEKKVIESAKAAGIPDVRMASIIDRLHRTKHAIVDFNRTYNHDADWIANAVREHGIRAFRAIICREGATGSAQALAPSDCSEDHPLFNAPISRDIPRSAADISGALLLLALAAREIDIVDPFFDLRAGVGDYIGPLASLFGKLARASSNPKVIRVHFRSHPSRPPAEILARDAGARVNGILPPGYRLELYEWSEIAGGEDFHDRFFLADVGGLMIGAGLSAEASAQTATFTLLDITHAQRLRGRFASTSTVYARVGRAVRFNANGSSEIF